VTFDQHPARKGKDDLTRCDAGRVLKDHQSKHTQPAKFIKDELQRRKYGLFKSIKHIFPLRFRPERRAKRTLHCPQSKDP
jgi:hypothetical protein